MIFGEESVQSDNLRTVLKTDNPMADFGSTTGPAVATDSRVAPISVQEVRARVRLFTGDDNVTIGVWLRQFDTAIDSLHGDEWDRLRIARQMMGGSAAEWMRKRVFFDWPHLREDIQTDFNHGHPHGVAPSQEFSRHWQPGERYLRKSKNVFQCFIVNDGRSRIREVMAAFFSGSLVRTG